MRRARRASAQAPIPVVRVMAELFVCRVERRAAQELAKELHGRLKVRRVCVRSDPSQDSSVIPIPRSGRGILIAPQSASAGASGVRTGPDLLAVPMLSAF